VVLAIVAVFVGFQLVKKLTNNTVVAYFPAANALYSGDRVSNCRLRSSTLAEREVAVSREVAKIERPL
jgi:phospholipid/cholesterol/gamma-HCH transport system substrate-binding protein